MTTQNPQLKNEGKCREPKLSVVHVLLLYNLYICPSLQIHKSIFRKTIPLYIPTTLSVNNSLQASSLKLQMHTKARNEPLLDPSDKATQTLLQSQSQNCMCGSGGGVMEVRRLADMARLGEEDAVLLDTFQIWDCLYNGCCSCPSTQPITAHY